MSPRRVTLLVVVCAWSVKSAALLVEQFDHFVGDVDARARPGSFLQDDVQVFLLRDLFDQLVSLLRFLENVKYKVVLTLTSCA